MLNDRLAEPWNWADEGDLPLWVPRVWTVRIPCGRHFEAIRVPAGEAARAHAILGPASGPVLASAYAQSWHFLLDLGAVSPGSWDVPGTRLLRPGTILGVPPAHITFGRDVRWVVLPGQGETDPAALQDAVAGRASMPSAVRRRDRRSASSHH